MRHCKKKGFNGNVRSCQWHLNMFFKICIQILCLPIGMLSFCYETRNGEAYRILEASQFSWIIILAGLIAMDPASLSFCMLCLPRYTLQVRLLHSDQETCTETPVRQAQMCECMLSWDWSASTKQHIFQNKNTLVFDGSLLFVLSLNNLIFE